MREAVVSVRKTVTWGLFAAWLVNDLEEWFTMSPWSRANVTRIEVSPGHTRAAISLMGVIMLAASARGVKTGGKSPFFQSALVGFGMHGVGHLALSVAHRGYTPGVATAPAVVIPFSLWAWRELRRAGVRGDDLSAWVGAAVLVPASLAVAHGGARVLIKLAGRSR
jgi:hypothetical protein